MVMATAKQKHLGIVPKPKDDIAGFAEFMGGLIGQTKGVSRANERPTLHHDEACATIEAQATRIARDINLVASLQQQISEALNALAKTRVDLETAERDRGRYVEQLDAIRAQCEAELAGDGGFGPAADGSKAMTLFVGGTRDDETTLRLVERLRERAASGSIVMKRAEAAREKRRAGVGKKARKR